MITNEQAARLSADFPPTFGLRGFPGDTFRLGLEACFESNGVLMVYTQRLIGESWADFAKGTVEELRREIVR